MTRVVLFDLGNVLVRLDPERAITRFLRLVRGRDSGPIPARQRLLVWFRRWVPVFSAGGLTADQYFSELDEVLGGGMVREELEGAWCDAFDPWPEMVSLAERVLSAGHEAYLLSNTDPVHFAHLEPTLPVLQRFSGLHLSFEAGVLKPDTAFFESAMKCFGFAAADAVFIDDIDENVQAARSLGIASHVHDGSVVDVETFLMREGVRLEEG